MRHGRPLFFPIAAVLIASLFCCSGALSLCRSTARRISWAASVGWLSGRALVFVRAGYQAIEPGHRAAVVLFRDEHELSGDAVGGGGGLADDAAASRLMAFRQKTTRNPLAQTRPPEFLALLVGKGDIAYRRSDGVLVIPVAALEA